MVGWWLVLYYPIIALLIFIGKKVSYRYPNGSVVRDRSEMALGCGLLALPGTPLILFIGSLVARNPHDPIIQLIMAFVLFWLAAALIFGGLVKFPWMRNAVSTLHSRIRAMFF